MMSKIAMLVVFLIWTNIEAEYIDELTEASTKHGYDETSVFDSRVLSTSEGTCDYNADSAYFTCSNKGRYRNPNDPTCQTYYLCILLRNGSFVQTLYKCPSTSFFSPLERVCDVNYKCPCISTTSTTILATTTKESITFAETEMFTTAKTATTQDEIDHTSKTDSTSSSTTTETCNYIEDSAYFTCSSKGRYSNPNDPTCQTYYLCILLRNGSFVQTLYKCPSTSSFSPLERVCDVNYKCPCISTTSTTILATTTEEYITSTDTEEVSTDKIATTESEVEETSKTDSTSSSTTTETCDYIEDSAYFTCRSKGRYRNPNDPTCQTYYLCILLRNGSFVQTLYKCPSTSSFSPLERVCDVNYKCPCISTTSTTILATTTEEYITSTDTEEVSTDKIATTESEVEETSKTDSTSSSTTTETCDYIEDSAYFTCRSKGRYRNPNDPTCQTYYLCILLRNGSFVQTLYKCPSTSFFNPLERVCDVNYKCPCISTTSTTILATTTEEYITSAETEVFTTTKTATTNDEIDHTSKTDSTSSSTTTGTCENIEDSANFTCRSKGRYRNPNDPTCQTYYFCILLRNGSFVQTLYKCPSTSFFSPLERVCDVNYKCPCISTTSTTILATTTEESITSTETEVFTTAKTATTQNGIDHTSKTDSTSSSTTTGTCENIEDSANFTCRSKGRYRNRNDPTCQTYYLCILLRNGSFVQTLYKCPSTSFFSPLERVCDVNYKCPCISTTSTTILATTTKESITSAETEVFTTAKTATTKDEIDHTSKTDSTSSSTTTGTCENIEDSANFTCRSKGRYRNPNDPTCQTYYLCILLRNGSFLQTLYKCPSTSFFSPLERVCDVNYKCPCISTTSTTILATTTEESIISTETEVFTTAKTATTKDEIDHTSKTDSTSSSTTTDTCDYIEDSANFTCRSKGRYRNPNDPTCQTYYLCILLRNGSFVQTLYKCPSTSSFSPLERVCDVNYRCPCISTTTTTILATTTEEYITSTDTEEVSTDKIATTESEVEETSKTDSTSSSTTTETCDYFEDSAYFTCRSKGRYRNPNDPTCQTYYICILLRNGSFVQTLYKCPSTSFFSPLERVCDVNYKCPCISTTSTTILATTTEESITYAETEVFTTTKTATTNDEIDHTSKTDSTSSSTTTGTCENIEDSANFTCRSKGRYRNPNDPTCQTYYLCILLRNGSFVQTLYKCPSTSFFSPLERVCDVNYKCPCISTTSTTILATTTEESIISTETEVFTTAKTATTKDEIDHTSKTDSTSSSTTTDTCDYIEDSANFTCSSKGRYRNPNDPTCQTYYLCILLRNGSFVQTLYKCPSISFFSPLERVCDVNYKCPCISTTSTTILATTTKESITSAETEVFTTAETATTKDEIDHTSKTDSTSSSTTTDTCDYIGDSAYFTCSSKGRYSNPNDPTCQTYYLCILLRNGSFVQTLYKCPSTSSFSPLERVCDVNYKCPCISTTSTTILATTTEEYITSTDTEEVSTDKIATTESEVEKTSKTDSTSSSTTTETCDYIEDSAYFTCRSKGRYRNPNDPTCQTYYLCILLRNGSFVQTLYKCPSTSSFSPLERVCDVNYKCPCISTTSTTILATTTEEYITSTDTEEVSTDKIATTESEVEETSKTDSTSSSTTTETCDYIEDSAYFTCSSKGRYRNPNDPTCQTYYLCILLRNGSFVQTLYKCPSTSFFSPLERVCNVNYKCPCISTTSTTILATSTQESITSTETEVFTTAKTATTQDEIDHTSKTDSTLSSNTTETCDYIEDSVNFTCSSKGRYRNPNDPTCQTYYLCILLRNGSFVQTLYKCPSTSFFSPLERVCNVNYKCPCISTTSTTILATSTQESITSTETEVFTTAETATTKDEIDHTSKTDSTSSSTTTDTCDYIGDSANFTCSSKGRYPNPNDPACQTYYLCIPLRNGSFVQTLYKCPSTSFFSPLERVCDVNYKCPCISTTSTTILATTTEESITSTETEVFTTAKTATTQRESDGISKTESTSSSTTTKTCDFVADLACFTCSSKGRYQNLNDSTCQTYYLCNLLRNGSFMQTLYKCPSTSFFNPLQRVCDVNYKCPYLSTTNTTILATTTEKSFTITKTEESDFNCPSTGIFEDKNDLTCKRFYVCIRVLLSYISTHLTCPQGTHFDPLFRLCSPLYSCSHSPKVSSVGYVQEVTSDEPRKRTDFWKDESMPGIQMLSFIPSTIRTITRLDGSIEPMNSVGVTATKNTNPILPVIHDQEIDFTCSSTGIFGNDEDVDCKRFFICIKSFTTYIMVHLTCPEGTYFDPFFHSCNPFYFCPHHHN